MAIAAFLAVAALGHFTVWTERARMEQDLRNRITHRALGLVAQLTSELNANVSLANGMYALISAVPHAGEREFQAALRAVQQYGRHVRNVGLAPDNRLTQIYPLEGNEAVLGLYYPDVPSQWPAVKRAMDLGTTVLAGPLRLRQGGLGLVSRTPVFREDGSYWGMLSLVLDADALIQAAGLLPEVRGVRYALRGRDGKGETGDIFFGDGAVFGSDAVQLPFDVPGGTWVIAAQPVEGWSAGQAALDLLESVILAGGLILALAVYGYQRSRVRIRASEKRLRAIMETAQDGVIVIDERGLVREFNPAAERLFGYGARELLNTPLTRLMPEQVAREHDGHVRASSKEGVRLMGAGREIVGKRRDGTTFPAEISVGNVQVADERLFVGVVRDITQRKAYEQQLVELATTDGLTRTLNRRAFMDEGAAAHQLALRHGRPLALMMVDADHFKQVNDTYGHQVGDQVLVRLAQVMQDCLRATDKLGRIGGEEFAVLMPETDLVQALAVCNRLLQAVRDTTVEADGGDHIRFTVSIGIAALSPDSRGIGDLMRQADAALYRAKSEGRNRCCQAGADQAPPLP